MSDASIPLGVRIPQAPDVSEMLQRGLSIQNLAQNTQMNAVRLQEERMKVQAAEDFRENSQKLQRAFNDPQFQIDDPDRPGQKTMDLAKFNAHIDRTISRPVVTQWHKDNLESEKGFREMDLIKKQQVLADTKLIGDAVMGANQLSDENKPPYWAGVVQQLKAKNVNLAAYGVPETLAGDGSTNEILRALASRAGYTAAMDTNAKRQEEADRLAQQTRAQEATTTEQTKQRLREQAAREYPSKGKTKYGHETFLANLNPLIRDEYQGYEFDPATTPQLINDHALNANQRQVSADKVKPEPALKTEVKQLQISGKPHQVLINSQTGAVIKDLGESGERPPTLVAGSSPDDPKLIAQGIINGHQPPVMTGLYRSGSPVRAELERQGFNLATANRDWTAIQKHLSTLNGAQQERLRQAVSFTYDSLDQIESLYDEWKKEGGVSGIKLFNRANLLVSKNLSGRAGEVATLLDAQINDLTSELGTVYKGGNSSTDESLLLASTNLKSEWNETTFKRGIEQIRKNLQIRRNSILTSQPVGVSPNSPYAPSQQPATTPAIPQIPATLSQTDVGKVYMGAGGKKLKITAVNPANPKQFQSQEVQ